MAIKLDGALGDVIDAIADRFTTRLSEKISGFTRNGAVARNGADGRRASKLKGRKLDMHCRYPGCKNRSKGPKFHFLCEKHLKNPGWPAAKAKVEAKSAKTEV